MNIKSKINTKLFLLTILLTIWTSSFFVYENADARGSSGRSSGSRSVSKTTSSSKSSSSKSTTPSKSTTSWSSKSTTSTPVVVNRATLMTNQKSATNKATLAKSKSVVSATTSKDWGSSKASYLSSKGTLTKTYVPKTSESTKYTGETKTVIINRYNNTHGGYYYADPYDHGMIWNFSTIWWYHHWATIDRTHYADDEKMKELELEIEKLKLQGIAVNSDYTEDGMDETIMYSEGYLQGVKDGKITEDDFEPTDLSQNNNSDSMCFIGVLFN